MKKKPTTVRSSPLVRAKARGGSGRPVGAQAAVPADMAAIEAALTNLAEALVKGAPTLDGPAFSKLCTLFGRLNEIVATQRSRTAIGGNDQDQVPRA